ncbi:Alcohol acetyltransferase [Purpureocillium takamizusanense]|uniref:Alcohol acetyltransferase n=1 Tax=Purpureocillium takamizusanense TaxID=2060973 RepID=A0A9Q8QQ97_9HYPO|nr:Alcohol acetyltransferase [Purpureocillium takamizusanense]UNI23790.1 Alcohol acetyltransferase [Purpureocillium takamizusanense]
MTVPNGATPERYGDTKKGAATKPRLIRKLGCLELYQASLHALDMYRGTSIACTYCIPGRLASSGQQEELEEALHSAVARTVLQHPVLQVGIYREASRKPAYLQLDTVDLRQHVEWRTVESEDELEAMARETLIAQIDTKFEDLEVRPAWRIAVLRRRDSRALEVNFVWHHALADGMSGKMFHETLLRHLTSVVGDGPMIPPDESRILDVSNSARRFPPPMEKMVKYPVSVGYTLSTLWQDVRPQMAGSARHQVLAHWAPLRLTPPKTDIRRVRLSNERLRVVLAACRRHSTTLTGLLHGIVAVALSSLLSKGRAAGFLAKTAMNMRVATPASASLIPKETMADIVSVVGHTYDLKTTAGIRSKIEAAATQASEKGRQVTLAEVVWSSATAARADIKKALDKGVKDNIIGVMGFVPDWRDHGRSVAKKPRESSWVITNLGVIERGVSDAQEGEGCDDGGKWHIEGASFSINAQSTGAAISLCVIAVERGDLVLDVCWQRDVIDSMVAEGVAQVIEDWLTYFGTDRPTT